MELDANVQDYIDSSQGLTEGDIALIYMFERYIFFYKSQSQ